MNRFTIREGTRYHLAYGSRMLLSRCLVQLIVLRAVQHIAIVYYNDTLSCVVI